MAETPPSSEKTEPEKSPEVVGPRLPDQPSTSGVALPPLPLAYVGIIAVLLVIAAIAAGLAIGTIARPSPTPQPTPVRTVAVATPTPVPTTDPQVFRQTLTGACATQQGLWVVTNGGGLLRYDGQHWTQIDSTLRTLTAASCDEGTLYAVGPVGAMLIVDDRLRQITSFDVTLADLLGVAAMPEGAMAVGTRRHRHVPVRWIVAGVRARPRRGSVRHRRLRPAVRVGRGFAAARAIDSKPPAGVRCRPASTVALRAVVGNGPAKRRRRRAMPGRILVFDGTWKPVESGVTTNLRAIARAGQREWIVGDAGTVLILDAAGGDHTQPGAGRSTKFDLGTTCDLRSVFVNGQDVWVIGSTGLARWRLANSRRHRRRAMGSVLKTIDAAAVAVHPSP